MFYISDNKVNDETKGHLNTTILVLPRPSGSVFVGVKQSTIQNVKSYIVYANNYVMYVMNYVSRNYIVHANILCVAQKYFLEYMI